MNEQLERAVESLQSRLVPSFVEAQVRDLLRQGEDIGGGVNAARLVRYWLGSLTEKDEAVTWAYGRLKPALGAALAQIPSPYYFEGD